MDVTMKYVYEIYRQGSFTKAAEVLYVTQPTLSIAVKKLEAELGVPIFERKNNPITLTPAGEIFIEKTKLFLQIEQDMHDEIDDIKGLKSGELRIGGTNYVNSCILPPILSQFITLYPNIDLNVIESRSDQLLQKVIDNEVDISFNTGGDDDPRFSTIPAFRDEIYLAVPNHFISTRMGFNKPFASYGWKRSKINRIDIKDIGIFSEVPFMLLKQMNNLYRKSLDILDQAAFEPRIVQWVEQLATAYRFCIEGIGATFIGSRLINKNQIDHRITLFAMDGDLTERQFFAVMNKNRYLSHAMQAFNHIVQANDIAV